MTYPNGRQIGIYSLDALDNWINSATGFGATMSTAPTLPSTPCTNNSQNEVTDSSTTLGYALIPIALRLAFACAALSSSLSAGCVGVDGASVDPNRYVVYEDGSAKTLRPVQLWTMLVNAPFSPLRHAPLCPGGVPFR